MRLLFIPSWFPSEKDIYAGSFIKQLALDLSESEIEIVVLNFAYSFGKAEVKIQTEIVNKQLTVYHFFGFQLPKASKFFQDLWIARCFKTFQKLSIQGSFDLVHSHDYVGSFLGKHFSEQLSIDHITTLHHSDFIEKTIPQWRVKLLRKVFSNCSRVLAPSVALGNSIKEEYDVEVNVIPHYIHWQIKQRESLPVVTSKAIAVTSLEKIKSNQGLIDYCKLNSIQVDIYGEVEKNLLETSSDLISFQGKTPHKDLLAKYGEYGFFISYSSVETFGIAALEAMSMGLPVFIRNKVGAQDFVTAETGMFIENEDSFTEFKARYENYNPRVIANQAHSKFSKQVVISKYLAIYNSAD